MTKSGEMTKRLHPGEGERSGELHTDVRLVPGTVHRGKGCKDEEKGTNDA